MATIKETTKSVADTIEALYGRSEAEAIARLVVADRLNVSFSYLLAHGSQECSIDGLEAITARLAEGCPVQYVLGHCEFCGLDFEVGEGVLIPRPETEEVVEAVVARINPDARLLDLCTGSGCIAIALAKRLPESRVTAVDISPAALAYARRNAARNGVSAHFAEADVLDSRFAGSFGVRFDAIVSNPPYIPRSEQQQMHINVTRYEPHAALFVSDDRPEIFYEAIAGTALQILNDGGLLCFEVHENHARSIGRMLARKGFTNVEVIDDINGKPRIVCSRKP